MTLNDFNNSKNSCKFICEDCCFYSNNKNDFRRHNETYKHKKLKNDDLNDQKTQKNSFQCECGKIYKYKQGLSVHKKKCTGKTELMLEATNLQELVIKLLTDNQEMKKENQQLIHTITDLIPQMGNNNNNTINNNQKFNINIFLNEKCKDALTIDEFVEKIEISMKNLLTTKDKGLGEGLSNIVIENMNKLSLYERPIHCTDKKRETIYIKNNEWEKDETKDKINKFLKKVEHKQVKNIEQWPFCPNYFSLHPKINNLFGVLFHSFLLLYI